jgi:hypothetical protein
MAKYGQHAVANRSRLPTGRSRCPTAAIRAVLRESFPVGQSNGRVSGSSRSHAAGLSSDLPHDPSIFRTFSLRDLALSVGCQRMSSIPAAGQTKALQRTGAGTNRPFAIAHAECPASRPAGPSVAAARPRVALHLSASRSRATSVRGNCEGFGNSRRNRGFALEPCAGRVKGTPR